MRLLLLIPITSMPCFATHAASAASRNDRVPLPSSPPRRGAHAVVVAALALQIIRTIGAHVLPPVAMYRPRENRGPGDGAGSVATRRPFASTHRSSRDDVAAATTRQITIALLLLASAESDRRARLREVAGHRRSKSPTAPMRGHGAHGADDRPLAALTANHTLRVNREEFTWPAHDGQVKS